MMHPNLTWPDGFLIFLGPRWPSRLSIQHAWMGLVSISGCRFYNDAVTDGYVPKGLVENVYWCLLFQSHAWTLHFTSLYRVWMVFPISIDMDHLQTYEKNRCSRFAGTHMYLRIQHIRKGQMQRVTGNLCIGMPFFEGTLVIFSGCFV